MTTREDHDATTITLDNGQSVSGQRADGALTVDSTNADLIKIFVDDGTTGNTPATYDLQADEHKRGAGFTDDWMLDRAFAGETARKWTFERVGGAEYRVDLTNTSGTNGQTYRIFVEALREED